MEPGSDPQLQPGRQRTGKPEGRSCYPSEHQAILKDPARRASEMTEDDEWTVGGEVLGRYYKCKLCGRKELLSSGKPAKKRRGS